jgi:phage-related protein
VRPVTFLGDSLRELRRFPVDARHDAGYQLAKLQRGGAADDSKAMASIGHGVEELRIWSQEGTFRVVYVARFAEAVYVLSAFQKKSRATTRRDLAIVRARLVELATMRR